MNSSARIVLALIVIVGIGALAVLGVVYRGSLFTFLGLSGDQAASLKQMVSNDQAAFCENASGVLIEEDGLKKCSNVTEQAFAEACGNNVTKSIGGSFICLTPSHELQLETYCINSPINGVYDAANVSCTVAQATANQQQGVEATRILNVGSVITLETGSPLQQTGEPKVLQQGILSQNGTAGEAITCLLYQDSVKNNDGTVTGCTDACKPGEEFKGYRQGVETGSRVAICSSVITTPNNVGTSTTGTTTTTITSGQETTTNSKSSSTAVEQTSSPTPTPTPTATATPKPSATATATPTQTATLSKTGSEGQTAVIVVALMLIAGGVLFVKVGKKA